MMQSVAANLRRRLGLLGLLPLLYFGVGTTNGFASDDSTLVRYRSSDLATEAGARRVLGKIEAAAHQVCFDQERLPLPLLLARQRCYQAAVAHSVETVNAEKVTAAYVLKYGPLLSSGTRAVRSAGPKARERT